ncbi:bifunctional 3-dehydroquinate dehydratase/shikimate dehydrogenase, chloroplastic-like isoform X2 [Arachis stenosperma]|uniref:bifunctional 3-dehydroquinate dehydratase/shikimate dehydrogenase, chloroplastic-like isoform X2 n=1 Tax=Arachis stenosperma TaxID=217475 RepID=UPI0025AD60DA|nr:bifunctional 3-dehydroquinate dehydratase/shikimate dehydrogenase, chloroplastic-like isoform X2 [Arachis stenosperma]
MTMANVPLVGKDLGTVAGGGGRGRKNSCLVCAVMMAKSVEEALIVMWKAKEAGADLVEVRLDLLKNFNPSHHLQLLINNRPLPTLITYRPIWEGGQYDGDESKRQSTLRLAIELGSDFVDVELKVAHEFYKSLGGKKHESVKIMVSSHNFENTPSIEELGNLAATIQSVGADIVKIATTALDITDSARVLQVLVHSQVPMIGIAMGEKGFMTRILSAKFGGFLTFASMEAGIESAAGQPCISDLLDLYNFRLIGPNTKVHGVIGNPISHSKSPHVYNPAFNYTIPHKEDGLRCCDEVDPIAKEIGAISCMIKRLQDGKLLGYNVDYLGAITAIEKGLTESIGRSKSSSPLSGRLFVVIGAGGAGKALAYGAKVKGARVVVANRTYAKAKELAKKVGGEAIILSDLEKFHPEEGMVLANTTSIGMKPNIDHTPLPKEALKHYCLVFDAIYTPKSTRLLQEAQEAGAAVVYGTEMFINQAFQQFENFTNLPAPKQIIRDVLAKNI